VLDTDGNGRLTFVEFAMACREIGWTEVKSLWPQLDTDRTGFICLKELDPEGVDDINALKATLQLFFDTLDEVWHGALDRDGSSRCTKDEFVKTVRALGFPRDARRVFESLDVSSEGVLSMDELSFLGLPRAAKAPTRSELMKARMDKGSFREWLAHKYKNLMKAWSFGVDPEHKVHLSSQDFARALRRMKCPANPWHLWIDLVGSPNGQLVLKMVAPIEGALFEKFKQFLREDAVHANGVGFLFLEEAWIQAYARNCDDQSGAIQMARIGVDTFCRVTRELGYEGDCDLLFACLDTRDRRDISMEEMRVLGLPMWPKHKRLLMTGQGIRVSLNPVEARRLSMVDFKSLGVKKKAMKRGMTSAFGGAIAEEDEEEDRPSPLPARRGSVLRKAKVKARRSSTVQAIAEEE